MARSAPNELPIGGPLQLQDVFVPLPSITGQPEHHSLRSGSPPTSRSMNGAFAGDLRSDVGEEELEESMDSISLSSSYFSTGCEDLQMVNLNSDSEDEVDFFLLPMPAGDGAATATDPWMTCEAGEWVELKDDDAAAAAAEESKSSPFVWVRYIPSSWTPTSASLIVSLKLLPKEEQQGPAKKKTFTAAPQRAQGRSNSDSSSSWEFVSAS